MRNSPNDIKFIKLCSTYGCTFFNIVVPYVLSKDFQEIQNSAPVLSDLLLQSPSIGSSNEEWAKLLGLPPAMNTLHRF